MRQRIRPHLTYANVMVTILAFVVLGGGTALASYVVSSNSQVGPGTISGHQPPSGKHANLIPGTVNGQDLSGTLKTSLRLHCPSDLQPVPDQAPVLCSETSTRDPASYTTALNRCAAVNLRLPTDGELALVFQNSAAPQSFQWTSTHYYTNNWRATGLNMSESRQIAMAESAAINTFGYRCVTTPRN
jgi:hypothetical protein